jgi:hypothetical protein
MYCPKTLAEVIRSLGEQILSLDVNLTPINRSITIDEIPHVLFSRSEVPVLAFCLAHPAESFIFSACDPCRLPLNSVSSKVQGLTIN